MIKAIFFDIDGTLVSFNTHTIPESTRKALELLRKKGIKIFIATGRPKMLMMRAVGNLEFDGYVTLNGSYCFTADHQDIYKGEIPQEDVERLIDYHKQHPQTPFVFVHDDEWFITNVNEAVNDVARLIEITVPPTQPVENARGKNILQIMGYFEQDEDIEVFRKVLTHCEPMRWYPTFADIIAKGNSKSHGIDKVLEYYDIKLEETMAFGDGGNDIPMLAHVGLSVAMGNAAPHVQEAAKYVTTSVDEDGIWNALKHFNVI
ncbi:Cof-type HAD-IIB family hydrolase [uncultured Bacteroides sp.]|uniref:Cof-type HAD-IIB family hydrolase n=1 Tax=uncultured Bacteroides sp. TaxID=162156 RepID=UPI002630931D|nr:Cof-type HAD-IIB family hydrolase [uncultured Bacteroides sp.]